MRAKSHVICSRHVYVACSCLVDAQIIMSIQIMFRFRSSPEPCANMLYVIRALGSRIPKPQPYDLQIYLLQPLCPYRTVLLSYFVQSAMCISVRV